MLLRSPVVISLFALVAFLGAADQPKYPTQKALEERTVGMQKFVLLPGVKVQAKSEATVDMIFATGSPHSCLPAAIVKKIGATIIGQLDITYDQITRASLALSGANPKNQLKFDVARISAWSLGVGPPGQQLDVLVIASDRPGFGVVGRDWMQACKEGGNGIISSPWMVYFGRMVDMENGPTVIPAGQSPKDADDVADVPSQEIKIGGDERQRFFLIGPTMDSKTPDAGRGLVIIMPGGDGSADFHPFVKRIFKHALPEGYLAAQPVAVKWKAEQKIVWPTETNKADEMKFSTEKFVEAVIADVAAKHKLDPKRIYTLSWSSSGPAAYAISLTSKSVVGSFVAMSVFNPKFLSPLDAAKGHAYFLYHSPDDRVCPYRMAKDAEKTLQEKGAKVQLTDYAGGHGWRGGLYEQIRGGIDWLEKNTSGR